MLCGWPETCKQQRAGAGTTEASVAERFQPGRGLFGNTWVPWTSRDDCTETSWNFQLFWSPYYLKSNYCLGFFCLKTGSFYYTMASILASERIGVNILGIVETDFFLSLWTRPQIVLRKTTLKINPGHFSLWHKGCTMKLATQLPPKHSEEVNKHSSPTINNNNF